MEWSWGMIWFRVIEALLFFIVMYFNYEWAIIYLVIIIMLELLMRGIGKK